jgi:integrase
LYEVKSLASKSRNQAVYALRFLYENIVKKPLDELQCKKLLAKVSKHARRTLISKPDIAKLFATLPRQHRLLYQLMYAAAMRLDDAIQLRVKDFSFDESQITINDCKHEHFRTVPFPRSLHDAVRRQMESVRVLQVHDETDNPNGVPLPGALARKSPDDARSLSWYWLFPSDSLSRDPMTKFFGRNHMHPDHCRKVFRTSLKKAGIDRRIKPHDIRRTAATRMHFEMNMPLVRLQYILGHTSLEQTRQYILEDEIQINGSMSPFDDLPQIN